MKTKSTFSNATLAAAIANALLVGSASANDRMAPSHMTYETEDGKQVSLPISDLGEPNPVQVSVDPLSGDIAIVASESVKDLESIYSVVGKYFETMPTATMAEAVHSFATGRPEDVGQGKSLGSCVSASVTAALGSIGWGLACPTAISAAAASGVGIGAEPWLVSTCTTAAWGIGAAAATAIDQCVDYGVTHGSNVDRHRSLSTAWSAGHIGTEVRTNCPNNMHLARRIEWQVSSGRVSRVRVGCTSSDTHWASVTGLGGGTTYSYTCGAGRTIDRIEVKSNGSQVTAILPSCGKVRGTRDWTYNSTHSNVFSSASGASYSNLSCPTDHNHGSISAKRTAAGMVGGLKLHCH